MELVHVAEMAAIAGARHRGLGDKNGLDGAAVDAMRAALKSMPIDGVVVIGEGEKDEAPMLYIGEHVGSGSAPMVDIAVDPIDGTTLLSKGLQGAISAIALSSRGTMNCPREMVYVNKIAVGPEAKDVIDIDAPPTTNLKNIARATGRPVEGLTVVVLDRPRHEQLLADIRAAGARVKLISDGDVAAGIQAAMPDYDVDVLMGVGGTPEAVLTAAALRSIGGAIQCKPWPRDDKDRQLAKDAGLDLEAVYKTDDLVGGDDVLFVATGASDGELLKGVHVEGNVVKTYSLAIHSRYGTIWRIETHHDAGHLGTAGHSP